MLKSNIHFRLASADEASLICQFQIEMALETENLKLNHQTVLLGVQSVLDNPHLGRYYVALNAEQIIGCLLMTAEWSDWRNGYMAWIHSLYLTPAVRGQKIFTDFFNFIKSEIQNNQNYFGIRLYVDKTNLHAQKVYKKIGMNNNHYELFEWMK